MKKICFSILFLNLAIAAFGQTTESGKTQSELSSSRAWYVLRQWNAGPLLLGLPQRLGKVVESSQRDDFMWTGTEQGGSLRLNIAVEGDMTGEIFIGLFKDPNWTSEPVQVRSFTVPGDYIVENLPAGKFHIGAMIGSLPAATALGVQQTWPDPVKIERDQTHSVNVLVSSDFLLRSSGWHNDTVLRDFIGDWSDMDTDDLLQGRVTGYDGQSVAFAIVQIREYNPGAGGIMAPNRGTNEQGYYKCDGINWPFTVGVIRYKLMPSVLGYCHQYLFYNRVFEECDTVDFQFDNYTVGNATLKGKVLDQRGDPLKEFFIDVTTKMDWEVRNNPDGKFYPMTGYHAAIISDDGSFKLDNLPEGDFDVRVIPFNIRMYEMSRRKDVKLQADKTAIINLEVVSKNVLYGRVLFRDGSPAVVKPTPWSGAKTSILLSMGRRARSVAEVDDEGYFAVHLSEKEIDLLESGANRLIINVPTGEERRKKSMGNFPFEKLSKDKNKAGILKIDRPDRKPLSLIGKPLPQFEGIDIEFDAEQAKSRILVCFFDIQQRPSRNCIRRLSKRTDELKSKGVVIVAIQASKVDEKTLNDWIKEKDISFPIGKIEGDTEQTRINWGVESLPWLILTDTEHIVRSEGININELDEELNYEPDKLKAFLNAEEILDGWESNYGSIKTMSVSYTDHLVDFEPLPTRDPNLIPTKYDYTERIEEGKRYHMRYSTAKDGFDNHEYLVEFAFNGKTTQSYLGHVRFGSIFLGQRGVMEETANRLKNYMLLNTHQTPSFLKEEYSDEIPELVMLFRMGMLRGKVTVLPNLESIAGQLCHVIEIKLPEQEKGPDKYKFVFWMAHDSGMCLLRYQCWDNNRLETYKLEKEIEVKQLGKVGMNGTEIWYPVKADRTLFDEDCGTIKNELIVKEFVPNIEVDEDSFRFDFPIGTEVFDEVRGISYVVQSEGPKSLLGKTLPSLKDFDINLSKSEFIDKSIVICFFDMEQRPSRNFIRKLSVKAEELKAKNIVIVAVQASKIDNKTLNDWVKENDISFPVGVIDGDVEKTRINWGVRSLPWLILTDTEHVVVAEGFMLGELDEKIMQTNGGK